MLRGMLARALVVTGCAMFTAVQASDCGQSLVSAPKGNPKVVDNVVLSDDNQQNTDPNDGTPYVPPPDTDTPHESESADRVGFDYMKIGSRKRDKWEGSREYKEDSIPAHEDFRIKLKRKDGKWPSGKICARIYSSHNKYFSISQDSFRKQECDRMRDFKNKQSIYVEDVPFPPMKGGKNYYFFAVITTESGKILNRSTRTDRREYVKVDIIKNRYDLSLTGLNHSAPDGIHPGNSLSVTATVTNSLDKTREQVEVSAWFDGRTQTVSLGAMEAGETRNVSFTFTAPETPGLYEVAILADPGGRIHETNGSNNRQTAIVTVLAPAVVVPEPVSQPQPETQPEASPPQQEEKSNENVAEKSTEAPTVVSFEIRYNGTKIDEATKGQIVSVFTQITPPIKPVSYRVVITKDTVPIDGFEGELTSGQPFAEMFRTLTENGRLEFELWLDNRPVRRISLRVKTDTRTEVTELVSARNIVASYRGDGQTDVISYEQADIFSTEETIGFIVEARSVRIPFRVSGLLRDRETGRVRGYVPTTRSYTSPATIVHFFSVDQPGTYVYEFMLNGKILDKKQVEVIP